MNTCLFCRKEGPFTRLEHIIPESLGNDDLVLFNEVCDNCNQYFGSKIESFVLGKTPLAFWRAFLGIRTKKGQLPHVELSQPRKDKGQFRTVHGSHDNLVGFTCHDDYSVSVDIQDDQIVKEILDDERKQFTFVFTPLVLVMMGRFLCKVGVELICSSDSDLARSEMFAQARAFSRFGEFKGLWPIFHFQAGKINELKHHRRDAQGVAEEIFCYHYRILQATEAYTLLALTVGTDNWVICLNDPYPTPVIRSAFPDQDLNLIWYAPEEMQSEKAPPTDSLDDCSAA